MTSLVLRTHGKRNKLVDLKYIARWLVVILLKFEVRKGLGAQRSDARGIRRLFNFPEAPPPKQDLFPEVDGPYAFSISEFETSKNRLSYDLRHARVNQMR